MLWLFADLGNVKFPLGDLLLKLAGTVLVPMMRGKAVLSIPWNDHVIRKSVTNYNKQVSRYLSALYAGSSVGEQRGGEGRGGRGVGKEGWKCTQM